jgi:hypothetical protein
MDELPKPPSSPDAASSTPAADDAGAPPQPPAAPEPHDGLRHLATVDALAPSTDAPMATSAANEMPATQSLQTDAPASTSPANEAPTPTPEGTESPTPIVAPVIDEATTAFRRVTRQASALAIGLCVATLAGTAFSQREGPPDLAAKKPWRASSKYAECHPERFDCGGAKTGIFFHTNLENGPWVEIDLLAPTTFSSVSVRNRTDCCQERAVPLILEASDDRTTWRELARHETVFSKWTPKFASTTARYVRLRVPRQSFLHLDAFNIHP